MHEKEEMHKMKDGKHKMMHETKKEHHKEEKHKKHHKK